MEEVITLISNQGFAIAMATYTIVTVNKSLQANTIAINSLKEQIATNKGE